MDECASTDSDVVPGPRCGVGKHNHQRNSLCLSDILRVAVVSDVVRTLVVRDRAPVLLALRLVDALGHHCLRDEQCRPHVRAFLLQ
jgi:hypothetical protein